VRGAYPKTFEFKRLGFGFGSVIELFPPPTVVVAPFFQWTDGEHNASDSWQRRLVVGRLEILMGMWRHQNHLRARLLIRRMRRRLQLRRKELRMRLGLPLQHLNSQALKVGAAD
jgi:hypothetical protein